MWSISRFRSAAAILPGRSGRARFAVALLLPFVVLAVQIAEWSALRPSTWYLFIAGVFVCSWVGGLLAGLLATAVSAVLVWFFFLPPAHAFFKYAPGYFVSTAVFLTLGALFSISHDLLRRAQRATRAANDELRASEARFAGIFATAFDAIIAVDEDQRIVLYNQSAADIFGYAPDEIVGRPLALLVPGRFRQIHQEHFRRFGADPEAARVMSKRPGAIVGVRKNGEEFPAEASISKLDLDHRRLFTVFLRDVTVRRRLESELVRTLEEQKFLAAIGEMFAFSLDPSETLRRVAQSSVEFIADFLIVDLLVDGRLRRLKVAYSDPAGVEVAQALEGLPSDQFQPPPVRTALETKQTQLWRTPVSEERLRENIPDPQARALVQAMRPQSRMYVPLIVRDRSIGVMTFVSSKPGRHYDVSDVRLAEEVARRAALALENSRLYKVARDAIEARDEILGIVAHDLRNPLNAIQLRAAMILRQLSSESRAGAEISVQAILHSSQRANRLIQDLLELRRIQVGRLTLRRAHVSPAQIVLDVVETQRPLLSSAALDLEIEMPTTLPAILADRDRVIQVFENLLSNAMKFTPRGGEITVGCREDASSILFWVRDTGPGILPDELPRLFDRFWQADGAEQRGMGLGLAIAKQVVDGHGGKIWAESLVGNGTTFFFTMPIAEFAAAETQIGIA